MVLKLTFQHFLFLFFILLVNNISTSFALKDELFDGNSNIESVFDAATSFMIPLIIFLSINYGMNVYLFGSFVILAIADMGLMILFTYFAYNHTSDIYFLIYFAILATLYMGNYLLILKESKFFKKSFYESGKSSKEKFIKKKLIPLLLLIVNIIFLSIAFIKGIVDFVNGLFITIPIIILTIFFVGFLIFYQKEKDKSIGIAHLRFLVEFMCSVIFVMITGPSVLWIKCYLSITIVELSLYLERAKPETLSRYRIDNFEKCKEILLNGSEKGKNYVLEIQLKENEKNDDNNNNGIQIISLNITTTTND